ncbi:hypothetical protein HKD37_01G001913 [Glycine soja]
MNLLFPPCILFVGDCECSRLAVRMNDNITLILHHGGRFTPRASDGKVEYIGREFDVWEDISADCLNAFILYDLVKACKKYSNIGECFWLIDKDLDFNHGLRSCTTDGDILHLVRDAFENENEINVYFHHEVYPILEEVPQMLYLECDPIPEAVENEDDLDYVPVTGHEEDVGAGEHVGVGEQRDAGEQRDKDTDAGKQERDVADSEEENEVDSDEWFTNFSCMMNEVEAEVETDEELNIPISSDDEDEDVEVYPQYSQSSGVGEQKLELGMEDLFQLYRKSCLVHLIDSVSCIFGKILQNNGKARNLKELCGNVQNPLLILQYRCKPIITMFEEIRSYIMITMAARKVKLSGKPGPLCPVQYKRLEKEIHFVNQWTPIWCGDNMGLRYEVHMWGNKVEVNLAEWTCTCGVWQLTRLWMSCRHAIATITHKGGKPEDIPRTTILGPDTHYTHPVPPHKRVQRGRPKKNRRRSVYEDNVTGHRLKRKLDEFTCGRCGQTNHNIRSYTNIGVPVRPKKYVAPSTSNEDDHLLSQDEQALNEAEEAVAHVQQDSSHLSQNSDMELMVLATIVSPIARNKLTITRAKQRKVADKDDANNLPGFLLALAVRIAARLPWWHCRMKLLKNAQQLPLVDMEKSTWETSSFVNPNLFGEEEATLREREFIDADLSVTLDSLRGTELPPMHLTNAVT